MNNTQPENDQSAFSRRSVCPSWLGFGLDNIVRRLVQNPEHILRPYIKPGWIVLDVGPGVGFFTIPLARLAGDSGKIIAAELQKKMLDGIYQRALRAGVQNRIKLHQSSPEKIGINEAIDFCLAFWMVHEVPDLLRFLSEISSILKPSGLFLLVEPKVHVSKEKFNDTLQIAKSTGLSVVERPGIFFSYSALLKKTDNPL